MCVELEHSLPSPLRIFTSPLTPRPAAGLILYTSDWICMLVSFCIFFFFFVFFHVNIDQIEQKMSTFRQCFFPLTVVKQAPILTGKIWD